MSSPTSPARAASGRGLRAGLRSRRTALAALAVLALAGAAGWWFWRPGLARPNVLLITVDTLRADHVGAYGATFARTPHMDRLAAEGVRMADAIASAPITVPSHASMLTGLYPPAHGVRDNGSAALPPAAVTLTEQLREAGYETQAFVSAVVLSRLYGLDQGFEGYDDDLWAEDAPRLFMIRDRPASRTTDRVLAWFDRWKATTDRRPFFTWVHFFDPHQPLQAPEEDRRGAASEYDAEITAADRAVGRIVEALREAGVLDDTIVVLTSDHGESLGEHGEATHAVFVYDATVKVPLVVRYPRALPAGRTYDGPVRHIDLLPTLLALTRAGTPAPGVQGVDLGPAWRGEAPAPALSQYSESLLSELGFGMAPLHALRSDGFKWISAPRPELYDLREDPRELNNLYPAAARRADALDRELQAILRATAVSPAATSPMSQETIEVLQSLGYLAQGAVRRSMGGMDPKDGIKYYALLEQGRQLAQQRRWAEAEQAVRQILAPLPDHVAARNVLGLTLLRQGRLDEARAAYEQSLATEPDQFRVMAMLGTLALLQRDLEEAHKRFTAALAMNPKFVEAMSNLGLVASLRGDAAAAEQWYVRAEAADPGFPATPRRFADLHYEQGRFAEALAYYERALARAPNHFPALVQAGNSARRTGDTARAEEYFRRAASLRPDSWIPAYNLACLYAVTGRPADALAALRDSRGRGLPSRALVLQDPDLAAVRGEPGFAALAAELPAGP